MYMNVFWRVIAHCSTLLHSLITTSLIGTRGRMPVYLNERPSFLFRIKQHILTTFFMSGMSGKYRVFFTSKRGHPFVCVVVYICNMFYVKLYHPSKYSICLHITPVHPRLPVSFAYVPLVSSSFTSKVASNPITLSSRTLNNVAGSTIVNNNNTTATTFALSKYSFSF